jgi:hypothetical protein
MYKSLYKNSRPSALIDNRNFVNPEAIIYEVPAKVNAYMPDETMEEKVNYSYGKNLKDKGASDVYSYRYNANYVGNRDVNDGIISVLDNNNRPFINDTIIQFDRDNKNQTKEGFENNDVNDNKEGDDEEDAPQTCSANQDAKSICGGAKLYPIMDPRFNLREAAKNMILLEDHLFHLGKRCQDCILKHCLTIEGFLEEGVTLDIKGKYTNILLKSNDDFRQIFIELAKKIKKGSLTNDDCVNFAQQIRQIRKPICQQFATFIS